MNSMQTSMLAGVMLAVVATLGWALNFITPYVSGAYSLYDLMVVRFLIAGIVGLMGTLLYRAHLRVLGPGQWCVAAALGALGCLGYGVCIAAGVVFGGPVLTPTLVGLVPVLLALVGNASDKTVQWRRLATPLASVTAGLLLSNLSSAHQPSLGIVASAGRVVFFGGCSGLVGWLQCDQPTAIDETAGVSHRALERADAAGRRARDAVPAACCAGAGLARTANRRFQPCPRQDRCMPGV